MKVDEVAKGLEAGNGRLVRCQPLIDPGLRLAGPTMGIVAAEERLAQQSGPFV
jgi:putative component of membrane protein insertase Oxa1/YidC/SpoIIIJ protein YidD